MVKERGRCQSGAEGSGKRQYLREPKKQNLTLRHLGQAE